MAQHTIGTTKQDEPAVSHRVVEAVARERDVDPLDLPPLYDVIDPDALDQLFDDTLSTGRTGPGRVVFTLDGCEVSVHSDGTIDVSVPDDRATAPPSDQVVGRADPETTFE